MATRSVIVHEWFGEGGPETFEYLLPCRNVDPEHARLFNDWIGRFVNRSPADAKRELKTYLDAIDTAEIARLTGLIRGLAPCSVIVFSETVWLLCKSPELLEERGAHGNMLLLPPPNDYQEWPNELTGDAFRPLRHLLRYFGGMTIDIPPTCGVLKPDGIAPAIEDYNTFNWRNVRSWAGSFPVYNVGNGDWVLANPDGRYGCWCHEMTDPAFVEKLVRDGMVRPDDGAVFLIGDFDDFLDYVIAQTGIAKPQ